MSKIYRLIIFIFFINFVFFISAGNTYAFTIKTGNTVTISQSQIIDDSLLVSGSDVYIEGTVNGDIICAGRRVEISGTVDGDVICAGQNLSVSGTVNGDLRAAGQTVLISGVVKRNATVFGQSIINEALIEGELLSAGQDITLNNRIVKNIWLAGQSVKLNADVFGRADLMVDNLTLGKKANIIGDLNYTSNNKLNQIEGAVVAGRVTRKPVPAEKTRVKSSWKNFPVRLGQRPKEPWLAGLFRSVVINLIVGLVLVLLFKERLIKVGDIAKGRDAKYFGVGLLILFLTPAMILTFLITIIGIPVALLILFTYILALGLSRVLTAIAIGRRVTAVYWKSLKHSLGWSAVIGIVVCWAVFKLPVVGWFFTILAVLWGLGGTYYFVRPEKK